MHAHAHTKWMPAHMHSSESLLGLAEHIALALAVAHQASSQLNVYVSMCCMDGMQLT